MADIIWNRFLPGEKKRYIEFLKIFGALSGLFKDNKEGANAKKPYLYYRNHEQLFARVFEVEDLTRKDSAFDALGVWGDERVGIGLKTWIHTNNRTYQKVAEFNKLAPEVLTPLMERGTPEQVVRKVAELRNDRIMLDKRLYRTDHDVYHFITRDDDVMNIVETPYDLIDIDSIEFIRTDGKVYLFKDRLHNYKFYKSKSVLLEEFDASQGEIIEKIQIEQYNDPFELIKMISIPGNKISLLHSQYEQADNFEEVDLVSEENNESYGVPESRYKLRNVIYLPLYQDKKEIPFVSDCSGINVRHGKPKNKGTNKPRPEYEVEVRISTWIHYLFPKFFGIDASNKDEVQDAVLNDFDLILTDGRILRGRIKQAGGKSLQTDPQGALGEWILKDVLGLKNREVVTWELLASLGIDSLKVTKIDDRHFKITVAETGAYEKFKLDYKEEMFQKGLKGTQLPKFRPDLVDEL
ncbi:hypothetical protein [Clostridium butyricum]|uniref:hypothetical protein n=1 Tax=Clostridium butyricum TaxID=1492 RepID=UPI0004092094|nr:hypothetical protein [Clostridium butyricum]